jgi:hypothetical protein
MINESDQSGGFLVINGDEMDCVIVCSVTSNQVFLLGFLFFKLSKHMRFQFMQHS